MLHNYHADGGGNITALLNNNSSSASVSGTYRYDAFGRTLAISGSIASANVYRFSSKPVQPNSGLYDYGFRFYDPSLQRWINRDPIGEAGGINVYGFVHNDPLIFVDPDGRHYGSVAADWYQDYAAALMGSTSTCKVYFGMMLDDWAEMFRLGEGAAVGDYSSDLGRAGALILAATGGKGGIAKHHSIPKASMKKMPPPVRNNPTVRGAKGKPNIKPVDKGKHVEAHSSPPGDYYPGGNYNRDYDKAVGDFDELTPERAREIADKCMEKYFE